MTNKIPTKDKIEIVLKTIALLSILLAAIEYFDSVQEREQQIRRQESARLTAEYINDVAPKSLRIRVQIMPYIAAFGFKRFNDPSIVTDSEAANLFEGIYLRGLNEKNPDPLLDDLLSVLGYFDRLNACLSTNLCDKNFVHMSICTAAVHFKKMQARMIDQYVMYFTEKGVDDGLEALSAQCSES